MDSVCAARGLPGWYCTETGWATDNSKQSAPIQEGFTREQSQGLLMARLMLIWGASPYCQGVTFWHCRDNYDGIPYKFAGINYGDWSPKPARTILEDFLGLYSECTVQSHMAIDSAYYSDLVCPTGPLSLGWTDATAWGGLTPQPQPVGVQLLFETSSATRIEWEQPGTLKVYGH